MKNTTRFISLAAGIVLFDYLFFRQEPGINTLLFTAVMMALCQISGRPVWGNYRQRISALGYVAAGIAVAVYASAMSVFAYMGAFVIFLGFNLEPELRSLIAAFPRASMNFLLAPASFKKELSGTLGLRKRVPRLLKAIKLLIIPLITLFVFVTIYRFADPLFNDYFLSLDKYFGNLITWLDQYLSIPHLTFLIFAGFMITGILYKGKILIISTLENSFPDVLVRNRKRRSFIPAGTPKFTGLKEEKQMGIVLLLLLNVLLLIVNITEVLWLNGEYRKASAPVMSQNLHEGTWLLIFSIVLSILVLMYLFRRNLNFYPGNRWLVTGAIAWIIQNGVMAANVATRNWLYISSYGLTYKRIGVIFFLLLVVMGLTFLLVKIRQKKSLFYLFSMSSWSFYFLFIIFALINWDQLIAGYNLRKGPGYAVDTEILLDLSARTLPYVYEHRQLLMVNGKTGENLPVERLNKRITGFMQHQEKLDWQSLNYHDREAFKYFRSINYKP